MLLTTAQELSFQPHKFAMQFANVRLNYFSGNTKSMNCVSNVGTCDVSWLTMLLENALLVGT